MQLTSAKIVQIFLFLHLYLRNVETEKQSIMEKEDPIAKFERKELERKTNGGLKTVVIVMCVVAAALAAAFVYVLMSKNSLVDQLNAEKEDLTAQIIALQTDYEGLSSDYDVINAQLDSSREEIAMLVERVRTTEATNRTKIRQYERELGTLRSIMRGYIEQIDSLNTLNHQLTAEAASARREAAESRRLNEELSQQVEHLGDGEEADADGDEVKACLQVYIAEREPVVHARDIHADNREDEAECHGEESLGEALAHEASHYGKPHDADKEQLRRTELERDAGKYREALSAALFSDLTSCPDIYII